MRVGAAQDGIESNLIGGDVVLLSEFAVFLPMTVIGMVSLFGGISVLAVTVGGAGMIGVLVMLLTLVISAKVGKHIKEGQLKEKAEADKLLGATREMLDGVKVVKMMGWEEAYLKHLCDKRATELHHLRLYRIIINVTVQLGRASPIIATVSTCIVYAMVGTLTTEVIIVII